LIRVAVIAPAMTLRVGLREVLGGLSDLDVVAEAARLEELTMQSSQQVREVDVLVTASPDGLRALDADSSPAVLLLTDDLDDVRELQNQSLPAWGVLPVNASEEELGAAVRALGEGLWVGSPALLRTLLRRPSVVEVSDTEPLPDPLTGREIQVLQMMASGLANKQIALSMGISEHTVKFHLSSLYAKLGVTSRTEAVRAGARRGLVVL
jgi:NarL family two-component system response regulator YdfI